MKKVFIIFLGIFLSSSVALAVTELTGLTNFVDVESGSWYESAVAELQQKNIIKGYDDGTYQPTRNVNRAELAIVISKALSFIAHPAGVDAWQRYIDDDEFLFVIDYPSSWESVQLTQNAVGFRPPWMPEDKVQWAVIIQDNEFNKMEELIAEMGAGYPDTRAETRQQIKLNGKDAWHVIVTTTEKPSWRHEQIFIPHFNKLYVVTNGAIENTDFELFWRSIKFLAPKEPEPESQATGENTETTDENQNESNSAQ